MTADARSAFTPDPPRWGLLRYVTAATLARSADGGGVVAIVLVATSSGAPGWHAGLLGACITAPHLLGPFLSRRLDSARDGRTVLAVACLVHGATLAAAVLLVPVTWALVPAALLIVSGLFGPFLTGGISSRLPSIVAADTRSQRRVQGWDVATYGLGGTIGPSVVAVISAAATPTIAALVLAAGTFAAAAIVRLLPAAPPALQGAEVPRPLRTLGIMIRSGPLRRTLYTTMAVAASVAVLPIVAVGSATSLGQAAAAAGALTAAYGLGNLAGSAFVMIRPLRSDADRAISALALVVSAALAAVLFAPTLPLAITAYAATGIANAYFFAATLAARSEYAPDTARGQVFVWVGALKITAGSAGTAAAGVLIGALVHAPVVAALALTAITALVSIADRATHTN